MTDPLIAITFNPLHATHEQAQAEFQPYGEIEIVSTFGEPQAEYAAIRKSAALIDLPQRGVIQLSGRDRLPFLNNLISNQTFNKETKTGIPAGSGVFAFLLAARTGRIIAEMNILELGDRTLLEMDARLVPTVTATLEKYLFLEQVKIERPPLHELAVHGPKAAAVLGEVDLQAPLGVTTTELFGVPVVVWRDDPAAVPGYHLILPADSARTVWMNLIARFGTLENNKRLLRPAGWAAYNAARIEGGRMLFGIDYDDTILPAETGQIARGVSFTKGCYAGQEVVARMHARQQVAKQLVGLRFDDGALPIAGAALFDDQQNQVGGITSSTVSPVLSNAAIALGLVRKAFIPPGSTVLAPAEAAMRRGTVVELPFVKPAAATTPMVEQTT